jgi:hypothetical protein
MDLPDAAALPDGKGAWVIDQFYHSNVINGFAAANPNNTRILVQSDVLFFAVGQFNTENLLMTAAGVRTDLPMKRCSVCVPRWENLSPMSGRIITVRCPAH